MTAAEKLSERMSEIGYMPTEEEIDEIVDGVMAELKKRGSRQ